MKVLNIIKKIKKWDSWYFIDCWKEENRKIMKGLNWIKFKSLIVIIKIVIDIVMFF